MDDNKYCSYCRKIGHWDSECWCTRPAGWSPEWENAHIHNFSFEPKKSKPFGFWHVGSTEEESDFFLYEDSGNVECPSCIPLYTHPKE